MNFKKKSINNKPINKISGFFTTIIGFFALIIVVYIGFFVFDSFGMKNIDIYKGIKTQISNKINKIESNIINIKTPEKEKYNILLTGVGGGVYDGGELTDTIILSSINTKKSLITMLSIPRDLYVNQGEGKEGKINEIYVKNLGKNKDPKTGMLSLENKIEEITGEKIDYYVNVDFEGFVKVVDLFGGVDVDVEETLVDTEYPNGKGGYTTFTLKKGNWTLDGETALKYARSRHSTSDFDGSLRQQKVIKGLKDKVQSEGILKNSLKIKELYDIFNKYMKTDLDLNTIIKLAGVFSEKKENQIFSFNLNTSCFYGTLSCEKGGFLYTPDRVDFYNSSVALPIGADKKNIDEYKTLNKFSNIIFNNQDFLIENYKINVFNSLKGGQYASELAGNLIKYGFNIPNKNSTGNTAKEKYEKSVIYYNDIPETSETIKLLKEMLNIPIERIEIPKYAKELDTKIEIIIGDDYLKKEAKTSSGIENIENKIFNF